MGEELGTTDGGFATSIGLALPERVSGTGDKEMRVEFSPVGRRRGCEVPGGTAENVYG